MLPPSNERVPENTPDGVDQRIWRRTVDSVLKYVEAEPEAIGWRLAELDREWDVERTLEANASSLILLGLLLGVYVDKGFLILPAAVAAFLLQHALQGWCPPLPILRRLGVRTRKEIEAERTALKVLRGDFRDAYDREPGKGFDVMKILYAARE